MLRRDIECSVDLDLRFPVLAGMCNLFYNSQRMSFSFGMNAFKFPTFEAVQDIVDYAGTAILKVRHEAFCCSWIRRDIVEDIEFVGVGKYNFDWGFSLECAKRDIPIHVDTRARFQHLAARSDHLEEFYVGIKNPEMRFEKC